MKNACILWTGGKDSMMALVETRERHHVACLATFVPDPPRPFRAHPLETMRAQAESLGLEHRTLPVAEPLLEGYERAIDELAGSGIDVLVTGDMDRVAGHDNWIVERARDVVEVERPLWHADRVAMLRKLQAREIRAVCTLCKDAAFDEPIAGRELDAALLEELIARHGIDGFDACGENGEFHTCVLDGPGFRHPLELIEPRTVHTGEFHSLEFESIRPQS